MALTERVKTPQHRLERHFFAHGVGFLFGEDQVSSLVLATASSGSEELCI